jgi:hypothetical protein
MACFSVDELCFARQLPELPADFEEKLVDFQLCDWTSKKEQLPPEPNMNC